MTNEENVDLATIGEIKGTLERPKSISRDNLTGTENIGPQDVRLPRLATAQGLSDQMTPGNSQYLPDLKMFDMFNDLTGEIYGKGPMTFICVRRDVRRMEFTPRSEGGGLVDPDVPPNDPRLKWTVGPDGTRYPPVATTFVEFVILLLRPGKAPEPIVLSIKGTNKYNRRASDQLTTFIKLLQGPIYLGLYSVAGGSEKNEKGTFGVPIIKYLGFLDIDNNAAHMALFKHAEQFHQSLEGKTIVVSREPGDEGDFDPSDLEGNKGAAGDM